MFLAAEFRWRLLFSLALVISALKPLRVRRRPTFDAWRPSCRRRGMLVIVTTDRMLELSFDPKGLVVN